MAAMLHGRNNRFFFPWEKTFFVMQNIFIVPAMQNLYSVCYVRLSRLLKVARDHCQPA